MKVPEVLSEVPSWAPKIPTGRRHPNKYCLKRVGRDRTFGHVPTNGNICVRCGIHITDPTTIGG